MNRIALIACAATLSVVPLAAQDSMPTRPPAAAPLRPLQFPPYKQLTLPNGLSLLLVENHDQPVLSVTLGLRAGSYYDPAGKEGLAALVAELLSKGTSARSAEQIAAQVEGVGGSLSASAGEDFLTVTADVLSDHADLAFDLLGDVMQRSTFTDAELGLARTRALSSLSLALSEPETVADRFFGREIYGHHPYGKAPTPESLRSITRDDVTRFATARLRPGAGLLVISGDMTLEQARALAGKAFGSWRGTAAAFPVSATLPAKASTDILLVHRPNSVQASIAVGNVTFGPADSGYYAARVATQVLGGVPDGRLFLILREQKSWSYDARAQLTRHRGPGYWEASTQVRTEAADSALAELLRQVERMRNQPVPDSELGAIKGFLVGSFPLTVETPQQVASVVSTAKLLGLPPDYVQRYRERLRAVTAAATLTAAKRVFRHAGLTVVVVGDAEKLYDRLKAIAPVRMVDIDGKPLTPEDLHPHGGPVAVDGTQLIARRDSFRVLIQGNPLGVLVSSVDKNGDSLVYNERTQIGMQFQQASTVVLDAPSMTVRRVDQTSDIQGMKPETHLTYANGRVKGKASAPQADRTVKRFDVDTALAAGTWDDNSLNLILPSLQLAPGSTFHLNVFVSSENAVRVLTVKVGQPDTVTVPAGTFHVYRLEIAGGQAPLAVYVTTDSPRHTVKTEVLGAPFVVELVK